MTYNCPRQLFGEIDRLMLLLFDFCRTDGELMAHRHAQKSVNDLRDEIEKNCNTSACRADKKICGKIKDDDRT
jgi:hypothetical protein